MSNTSGYGSKVQSEKPICSLMVLLGKPTCNEQQEAHFPPNSLKGNKKQLCLL